MSIGNYVRAPLALYQGDDSKLMTRADLEAAADFMLAGGDS